MPGSRLAEGAKYWWHARYQDNTGRWSAWSAETAFTTGDMPPRMSISLNANKVVLAWPTNKPGFTPESTTNLFPSASWTLVSPSPVVVGDQYRVTNNVLGKAQLYRLKRP